MIWVACTMNSACTDRCETTHTIGYYVRGLYLLASGTDASLSTSCGRFDPTHVTR